MEIPRFFLSTGPSAEGRALNAAMFGLALRDLVQARTARQQADHARLQELTRQREEREAAERAASAAELERDRAEFEAILDADGAA